MLKLHENLPFHHIEKWNTANNYSEDETLSSLGLVVNLTHRDGNECRCARVVERNLLVMHVNGSHSLRYYQCMSDKGLPRAASPEQLLANNLFPATDSEPKTAFTFELLRLYDNLDLSGFINIKQFLDGITGLGGPREGDEVRF